MATRKTFNILARKQQHLNHGVSTTKGGMNLYIDLDKHKLDQVAARNIKMSLDKRIAISDRVKLRRCWRKTYEDKYNIRDKNLLLFLQTVLITAGPRMQVNKIFTAIFTEQRTANVQMSRVIEVVS